MSSDALMTAAHPQEPDPDNESRPDQSFIERLIPYVLLAMTVAFFAAGLTLIFIGKTTAGGTLVSTSVITVVLAAVIDRCEEISVFGFTVRLRKDPR